MDLSFAKRFFFNSKKAVTDDVIFSLHYRYTVGFLLISATLIAGKFVYTLNTYRLMFLCSTLGNQFFNEKIECIHEKGYRTSVVNMQCWAQATYSVVREGYDSSASKYLQPNGESLTQHGVRQLLKGENFQKRAYYQWVAIALIIQALCFYLPRMMWRNKENCRMDTLLKDIRGFVYGDDVEARVANLAIYVADHPDELSSGLLNTYLLCKLLSLLNSMCQLVAIGYFLETDFITLGFEMVAYWWNGEGFDPMKILFPLLTKCNTQVYGPGGDENRYDNLCILPLNIFNAKIYSFLWVWLCFLTIITFFGLIFFFVQFKWCRQQRGGLILASLGITSTTDHNFRDMAQFIYSILSDSDYFLFSLVHKNLSCVNYRVFIEAYFKHVSTAFPGSGIGSSSTNTVEENV